MEPASGSSSQDLSGYVEVPPEEVVGVLMAAMGHKSWADVPVSDGEEGDTTIAPSGEEADTTVVPAEEAEGRPDPLNETLLPVRGNQGMSRRTIKNMEAEWEVVRRSLDEANALQEQADAAFKAASTELDAFLEAYGAEGRNLTGRYLRRVAYVKGFNTAGEAWLAEERKRRQEQLEAEDRILAFRRKTAGEAAARRAEAARLQRELNALRTRDPVKGRPVEAYKCPLCGLVGVQRGNECPNVLQHPRKST